MEVQITPQALGSRDCAQNLCDREAETGGLYCRVHTLGLAVKADAQSPPLKPCKTESCPHPANAEYDRGVFSGLCAEVCIAARAALAPFAASPPAPPTEEQR